MSAPVNLWTESAWAQRYLSERDDLPHRMEGFAVLMELLPPAPRSRGRRGLHDAVVLLEALRGRWSLHGHRDSPDTVAVGLSRAIREWEQDLMFLYEHYYVPLFQFGWPATEPFDA